MTSAEGRKDEQDYYREIVSRAKRMRERAAESLRRSRESRKRQPAGAQEPDSGTRRRRFRRD